MYKWIVNARGEETLVRISDGACIPSDPQNRDYADFLEQYNEDPAIVVETVDYRKDKSKPLPKVKFSDESKGK